MRRQAAAPHIKPEAPGTLPLWMRRLGAQVLAMLFCTGPALALSFDDYGYIEDATEQVVAQWLEADRDCRGLGDNTIIRFTGCARREFLDDLLYVRGWCRPGPPDQSRWQPCAPDAAPKSRTADCLIEVGGLRYTDGPCLIVERPPDEYVHRDPSWMLIDAIGPYFAILTLIDDNRIAVTKWNGDPPGPIASEGLGQLAIDGQCWASDRARVCVYE